MSFRRHKIKFFIAATILIAVGLYAFQRPAETKTVTYRIASSPDGSSLILRHGKTTEKVKLIGIDASLSPNTGAAKEYLNSLAGKKVTLKKDKNLGDKTADGKKLRYVYLGKSDLGLKLLKKGYAGEYQDKKYASRAKYQTAAKKTLNLHKYDAVVIYLHGGSYKNSARHYHYIFANEIDASASLKKFKLAIIVPDYPLAPDNDFRAAYDYLSYVYKQVRNSAKKLYLAGDSAGGGLALGLAEYINNQKDSKSPNGLVLISPWVDLTMSNPEIANYTSSDTHLKAKKLASAAKTWANGADLEGYRLSPINGNLKDLNKVLLFSGDRELLYPDINLLNEKLQAAGVNVTYQVGKGRQHIWPLERKSRTDTAETIVKFLKK